MRTRVRIPLVVLIWVVIGVIVAVNRGYADIDNGSELATFFLAVFLWPVLALDGSVAVNF